MAAAIAGLSGCLARYDLLSLGLEAGHQDPWEIDGTGPELVVLLLETYISMCELKRSNMAM